MIGTASSAFGAWYIEAKTNDTLAQFPKRSDDDVVSEQASSLTKRQNPPAPVSVVTSLAAGFNETFGLNLTEIVYGTWPNPFAGLKSSSPPLAKSATINMADGAEGGQAIPLWGQIQPARGLDLIIAWDDVEDAYPYNWNNGTNLWNTYNIANASGIPFPIVPPASTFVLNNYTTTPVFFGCNANLTTTGKPDSPIILYLANSPYSAYTNYSYTQTEIGGPQMNEIFVNSFDLLTQGNGTLDQEWSTCLGCAAIERSLAKVGMERTEQCDKCFSKYCWDGTYAEGKPQVVDPSLKLNPSLGFLQWNTTNPF